MPRPTHNSKISSGLRRIVHLGPGSFFRAHGAIYVQEAIRESGERWEIIGVSLKTPTIRNVLRRQKYLYFAMEKGPDTFLYQKINTIKNVLFLADDYGLTIDLLASRETSIVTLTITEKGYRRIPASGQLDLTNPDIQHDLKNDTAITAIGLLVHALVLRKSAEIPPFTILSCDNLPGNGKLIRNLVLEFAALKHPGLADWIAAEGRFPCCMVDRIVPATTNADLAEFRRLSNRDDLALVVHEPFRQWVIEDDFVGNIRPKLELAGVQFVADVAPFEAMKLRMLNGTHSTLAWLGALSGLATIHDAISDSVLAAFINGLWQHEIIPAVAAPPGQDLSAYARTLFDRYSNRNIRHLLAQIATDGSQKLPQRILATIADNLAAQRACPGLFLAVAGFVQYSLGLDENGRPLPVSDPMAKSVVRAISGAVSESDQIDAILAMPGLIPLKLANDPLFRAGLLAAWIALQSHGVRQSLRQINRDRSPSPHPA